MAIGNQPTVASVNNTLTALTIQLRNVCDLIRMQNTPITNLGQTGLENLGGQGEGFSSGDAAAVLAAFSYLSTVAGVYYGTATQSSEFSFDNELSQFWGGQ